MEWTNKTNGDGKNKKQNKKTKTKKGGIIRMINKKQIGNKIKKGILKKQKNNI